MTHEAKAFIIKNFWASITAPLGLLFLPVLFAALSLNHHNPQLPMDDAPQRAGYIFLHFIIPMVYPMLFLVFFAINYIMKITGVLSKIRLANLFTGFGILSIAIGIFFALSSHFGVKDQLWSFGVFSLYAMICCVNMIIIWWFMLKGKWKQKFKYGDRQ